MYLMYVYGIQIPLKVSTSSLKNEYKSELFSRESNQELT